VRQETLQKLAKFLKEERKKKKISQDKLSWKTDISKREIQVLETLKSKNPKLFTLMALCKGLGVTFSEMARRIE